MHCRICGKKSDEKRICKTCAYFIKHGATEEAIKRMQSDDEAKKIWKDNENIAKDLADVYYGSLIEGYSDKEVKNYSKEDFGYNTFIDGIRVGLDIIIPMLDEEMQDVVKAKIKAMVKLRGEFEKKN